MKLVGVPLAATGLVGAARNRGRTDDVNLSHLPGKVARRTVEMPGSKPKTQRATDAGTALAAGGLGGMATRAAGRTTRGKVALGTLGGVSVASGTLYGTQRGREAKRRNDRLSKADQRPQKMIKVPAPTAADTREDWKLHNQRRHASNYNAAATAVGAAALAARAPRLLKPKAGAAGAKLIRMQRRGDKASTILGGTAAGAYTVGGAINYKTQRHDLSVQGRRLQERDRQLKGTAVRKDRFLDEHRDRISPSAETGYNYLRRGRNKQRATAVVAAAATGVNAHTALRGGKVMRPVALLATGYTANSAIRNARGAQRWNGHMKKIKAKAYERAQAGVYGQGREIAKDDLAKALVRVRPSGLPFPKGLRRAPTMRAGGVRRTAGGKMVAFRGAYG